MNGNMMAGGNDRVSRLLRFILSNVQSAGSLNPYQGKAGRLFYKGQEPTAIHSQKPPPGAGRPGEPQIKRRSIQLKSHRGISPEEKHRLSMGPIGGSRVLPGPNMDQNQFMGGVGSPAVPPAKIETHPNAEPGLTGEPGHLNAAGEWEGTDPGGRFWYNRYHPSAVAARTERDKLVQQRLAEIEAKGKGPTDIAGIQAQSALAVAQEQTRGKVGVIEAGLPAKEQAAQDSMDKAIIGALRSDYGPEYLTAENVQAVREALKKKKKKDGEGEGGE